jgi:hypothetical protein
MKGIMGVEKEKALHDVLQECRRFQEFAKAALNRQRKEENFYANTREMGQVRRSSLDLSVALAKFRKLPVGF